MSSLNSLDESVGSFHLLWLSARPQTHMRGGVFEQYAPRAVAEEPRSAPTLDLVGPPESGRPFPHMLNVFVMESVLTPHEAFFF